MLNEIFNFPEGYILSAVSAQGKRSFFPYSGQVWMFLFFTIPTKVEFSSFSFYPVCCLYVRASMCTERAYIPIQPGSY